MQVLIEKYEKKECFTSYELISQSSDLNNIEILSEKLDKTVTK